MGLWNKKKSQKTDDVHRTKHVEPGVSEKYNPQPRDAYSVGLGDIWYNISRLLDDSAYDNGNTGPGWLSGSFALATLNECFAGDTVRVHFTGDTPSVRLIEKKYLELYKCGAGYVWYGTAVKDSPHDTDVPFDGVWYAVADYVNHPRMFDRTKWTASAEGEISFGLIRSDGHEDHALLAETCEDPVELADA